MERYKKYVGPQRWSDEEGLAEKATGVFEEISSVYGEENAAEMVRAWMLSVNLFVLCFSCLRMNMSFTPVGCVGAVIPVLLYFHTVVQWYSTISHCVLLGCICLCSCVAKAARGGEGVCAARGLPMLFYL